MNRIIILTVVSLSITACSAEPQHEMMDHSSMNHGGMPMTSEAYLSDIQGLPEAKEMEIVELNNGDRYEMVAQIVKKNIQGKEVKMLGYNTMIPGPLLKVEQGSTISILFKNETDEQAMLHSHGVRLNNAFDGTHLTQEAIPVGGSFEYTITFPDAGIYWYHPHLREDYTQELGLSGNYLVKSSDPNYWSEVNREVPLILDDLLMDDQGLVPFSSTEADHALMGRFGNVVLVNGSTDYQLELTQGEVVRFFLTNVANARPFRFTIPGAKLKLVGGDASKFERETFVDSVILAPSERYVIEVFFPNLGIFELRHEADGNQLLLGTVTVDETPAGQNYQKAFETLRVNQDVISEIDRYRPEFDRPVEKSLRMSVNMMGGMMMDHGPPGAGSMMGGQQKIEWEDDMGMMNSSSTTNSVTWQLIDEETGKANEEIDWKFQKGEVVKIKLFNDPKSMHPMQHPIHLHGQRFLVLSTNGERTENLVWKDTALVQTGDTVEILVEMSNPGKWMLHCHIAEHLEADMMVTFEVLE